GPAHGPLAAAPAPESRSGVHRAGDGNTHHRRALAHALSRPARDAGGTWLSAAAVNASRFVPAEAKTQDEWRVETRPTLRCWRDSAPTDCRRRVRPSRRPVAACVGGQALRW